jgi:predicted AAA+ superfamily ATPase
VIDEAQNIPSVGKGLKIIVDHVPDIRVIATGSSSFDLSNKIGEPLVGRQRILKLFPLSLLELY